VIPFAPAWSEHLRDRQWVVSQGDGRGPIWSPEGDKLFFVDQNSDLLAVDIDTTGDSFIFSAPRVLFRTPWDMGGSYGVTPARVGGGNHFHFVDSGAEDDEPLAVLINWASLLHRP
jgi:hypothetical protein